MFLHVRENPTSVAWAAQIAEWVATICGLAVVCITVGVSAYTASFASFGTEWAPFFYWFLLLARFEYVLLGFSKKTFTSEFERTLAGEAVTLKSLFYNARSAVWSTTWRALWYCCAYLGALMMTNGLWWAGFAGQLVAHLSMSKVSELFWKFRPTFVARGCDVRPLGEARRALARTWGGSQRYFAWCGLKVPQRLTKSCPFFMLYGAPGSGKTLLLRMWLRSALVRHSGSAGLSHQAASASWPCSP